MHPNAQANPASHSRIPTKRWLLRFVIVTSLGLVTTIAVTWSIAAFINISKRGTVHSDFGFGVPTPKEWRGYSPSSLTGTSFVRRMRTRNQRSMLGSSQPFRPIAAFFSRSLPAFSHDDPPKPDLAGEWGALRRQPDPNDLARVLLEDARGWPVLCLYAQFEDAGTEWKPSGGILLTPATTSDELTLRVLPLLPIWRGLFINTAVFAAAWAILILGLALLRGTIRRRRRRHGLCPKCGYCLTGISSGTCPECGASSIGA